MVVHIVQRLHWFDESRWLASPKRWLSNGPWWTNTWEWLTNLGWNTSSLFTQQPYRSSSLGEYHCSPKAWEILNHSAGGGWGERWRPPICFIFASTWENDQMGWNHQLDEHGNWKSTNFFIGETFSFMVDFPLSCSSSGLWIPPLEVLPAGSLRRSMWIPLEVGDFDFGKPPWNLSGSRWVQLGGLKHGVDFLQCSSRFWKKTLWIRVAFDHPRQKTRTWQGWGWAIGWFHWLENQGIATWECLQKNRVIVFHAQLRRWCFHLEIACFYCFLYVWYTGTVSHSSSMLQSRSCRSSYCFSIQTFSQQCQTFRQDVFCHFIISETWYCNSISFT